MTKTLTPDICVIGAGSGGLSVAAAAAALRVSVVLVERGKMGGDCLNYGCVPSKALIAAARQAQAMRSGQPFGIGAAEPEIDFAAVHRHLRATIAAIAPNDSAERFTALGVQVVKAEGRFKDRSTLMAGDMEICARRFVIATGSSPLIPPIPGLDAVDYLTNETIFDLAEMPEHLLVIGAGPFGLEMAQAYRRLGAQVTVVEAGDALAKEDRELSAIVLARLRSEGVEIREHTRIAAVERRGRHGVRLRLQADARPRILEGTHLLLATGRTANVAELRLDNAGVRHDAYGIKTNARLRSSNRRIYAVGDAAGSLQFTHAANYHAGLVVRSILFRLPARERRDIIPRVTFTDPEIAHVGMSEAEAARAYGAIRVLRWPYSENDRAHAEHRTDGHIKLVTSGRGRLLGVSIAGLHAGEMINFWALALARKMTARDIASYVAPYPTISEIGKRAAVAYFIPTTRNALVRRVVGLLRMLG